MLDEKDLKMHKAMLHILDNGSFSLKGREALAFAVVYKWFSELPEAKRPKVKKKRTTK